MIKNKPFIIAEAAQGYEGNPEIAKLLVIAAAKAGADAIKFQIIYADDIAVPNYQYYNLFKQLEMPLSDWQSIRSLAAELKIDFYADISGPKSANIGSKLSLDGVKIHSTCFYENTLFDWSIKHCSIILISIGGIEISEVKLKLKKYREYNLVVMHGYQAEPTLTSKNNLKRILGLQRKLDAEIGFMDHANGQGPDNLSISAMAMAMGVRVFEKHISLDHTLALEDHISALTPSIFKDYVNSLHRLFGALGNGSEQLKKEEIEYREKALKRTVAARRIERGKTIKSKDITLLRSVDERGTFKPDSVIGRTVKRTILKNNPIEESDVT